MKTITLALLIYLTTFQSLASAFDQKHEAWGKVLAKYLVVDGPTTRVRYLDLLKDQTELNNYLQEVSAVKLADFEKWTSDERLAFLFNAYNAFTVRFILDGLKKNPDLKSIKDLGSLFRSPWKVKFFKLFGEDSYLDRIEQELARPKFDEPRMHMAFNCASISCPSLNAQPFVAETLNAQLNAAADRFLEDQTKNKIDLAKGELKLSSIFKWYGGDFDKSAKFGPLKRFLADHLKVSEDLKSKLTSGSLSPRFMDYNWGLNIQR